MASSSSEVQATEKRENNADKPAIVILDSDEEGEETTIQLFQGFIKAAEPFLERKEILLLRVKFAELRPDFDCCSKFKEMLRRKANQVRKSDVYIHFHEILKELISNAAVYGKNDDKQNREIGAQTSGETTSHVETTVERNGTMAAKFEMHRRESSNNNTATTTSAESSKSNEVNIQVIDLEGQSSSQELESPEKSNKILTKEEQLAILLKRKRKKKVEKMETKLKYISDEIKRLSQSELSLEEMELSDSNYIRESRLKDQFNRVWNKICELKGRPPNTGRVVEQEIKVKESKFPAIDRAVQKFLKRKRGFPDIFDIRNIVIKTNKKHNMGLLPGVLLEIAADIFTQIGNKIQKKRKKDYEYNFGCHLTDDYLSSLDPALNDNALRRKLDENRKTNEKALDKVFDKYVHLGRIKGQCNQEGNLSSATQSESENCDDEKVSRKRARKKRRDTQDSDDDGRKSKKVKLRNTPMAASATSTYVEAVEVEINDSESADDAASTSKPLVNVTDENLTSQPVKPSSKSNDTDKKPNQDHDSIEIIDDDNDMMIISQPSESRLNNDNTENLPSSSNCIESPTNMDEEKSSSTQQSLEITKTIKESTQSPASLVNTTPTSNNKINVNASKLHIKIQELRNRQLSLQIRGKSEDIQSHTNLDLSDMTGKTVNLNKIEISSSSNSKEQLVKDSNNDCSSLDKIVISNIVSVGIPSSNCCSQSSELEHNTKSQGHSLSKNVNENSGLAEMSVSNVTTATHTSSSNNSPSKKPLLHKESLIAFHKVTQPSIAIRKMSLTDVSSTSRPSSINNSPSKKSLLHKESRGYSPSRKSNDSNGLDRVIASNVSRAIFSPKKSLLHKESRGCSPSRKSNDSNGIDKVIASNVSRAIFSPSKKSLLHKESRGCSPSRKSNDSNGLDKVIASNVSRAIFSPSKKSLLHKESRGCSPSRNSNDSNGLERAIVSNGTHSSSINNSPSRKSLLHKESRGCSPSRNSNDNNGLDTVIVSNVCRVTSSSSSDSSPTRKPLLPKESLDCSRSRHTNNPVPPLIHKRHILQAPNVSPSKRVCLGLSSVTATSCGKDKVRIKETVIVLSDDEE